MKKNFLYEDRLKSVREIMSFHQLDGILFSNLENIRYLCGFTGSDGTLLLTPHQSFFLTDSRYWTQAGEEVKGSKIIPYKKKMEEIVSLLLDLNMKTIGFESASLTFAFYKSLSERIANEARLIPLGNELKNLRAVKDEFELALIRQAIHIASQAFVQVINVIKEGISERDLALEMEYFMKRQGAEDIGFDLIIASGKRSALPHGKASDKKIERGEFILFDFGSGVQGYHSDQTRTLIFGTPSLEQREIYQVVREAHDRAIERIRPNISISEIDGAARDHIRNKGYGDYFGHGTGHGIGLSVHEDPVINSENHDLLQEGMIFTIEPGIYLPDWGGVRIEDMVLVTSTGAEILTYLPIDPIKE